MCRGAVWDTAKLNRFRWLWYDVTTYDTYAEETSYENSLLVQQTGALALHAVLHVVRSLTPNARGIFVLLVQHQLDNKDDSSYHGRYLHTTSCVTLVLYSVDLYLCAAAYVFING